MDKPGDIENAQRALLMKLWDAALGSADIAGKYGPFLPAVPRGRTVVIGAGKGAAAMAREFDAVWPGPLGGAVVTRHGYGLPFWKGRIDVLEAGHPVPDESSVAAGRKMGELIEGLGEDDLVIALISGGASALLIGLPDGVTLEDKQALTRQLLASGASIGEINLVRKHVSTVKGGKLARLAGPAPLVTFAVSDIPGDDIAAIGSGPTIADRTTLAEAMAILERHGVAVPTAIVRHFERERANAATVPPERPNDSAHLVVTPAASLQAAAGVARTAGFEPVILGDDLEGEARELGATHAQMALGLMEQGRKCCLLSGGETTVTIAADGRGGPNGEYLLGLVRALDGAPGISAMSADTDGIDGSEDNAGALAFASTLARAAAQGMDPCDSLARNDSYGFFSAVGDLLMTGPTYTNVNDFRAILIDPAVAEGARE